MKTYEPRTKPFAHQSRGLQFLIKNKGVGALVFDPGTGKTKTTIDYLAMCYLAKGAQDWLIAAPLSALDTWPDQFAQHLPEDVPLELVMLEGTIQAKADRIRALANEPHESLRVVLVNHDAFGSKGRATDPKTGKKLKTVTVWDRIIDAVMAWGPDGIVVDEVHRLKGRTSHRSKAFAKLAKATPKRIGLTGTVAPRDWLDVFGQWQFINPARFGTDWNRFRFTYARFGGWMDKEVVGYQNIERLKALLAADSAVAIKEECLDLPEVTDVELYVHLSPKEERAYREMGEEMLVNLPSGDVATSPIALTKVLRLRQLTGGFVGYETDRGVRAEEELGRSKAQVCRDKIEDLYDAGEKVVVFAHFRHDLTVLEEVLKPLAKKIPVFRIDGDTPKETRLAYRERFRDTDGPAVMLAQIRTMSLAVNELVAASNAIFYSYSERRDDFVQARDRLNRQGQTKPVTFYHAVVPDSVDEGLLKAHREKTKLEDVLLGADRDKYLTLGAK